MTRRNRRTARPKRGAMKPLAVILMICALVSPVAADPDPVRTKWEAAGDKLDLMVRTDGFRWRLPGGEQTADPVKIAAAPVLFQWLVTQDPADAAFEIHTIRAYRFIRGALSITDRSFRIAVGDDPGDVFHADAEPRRPRGRPRLVRVPVPVPVLVTVPR